MPGIRIDDIDRSVAPCDDFFRFANGKWLARTEIPAEEARWAAFNEIRDRNFGVLRTIAEEASATKAQAGSVSQKVGDWWTTGMDEAAIDKAGIQAISAELDLIAGLTDRAQLHGVLARLHREKLSAGFALAVRQDPGDSTRNILWLQQAGLGMPDRDYYLKDDEKTREIRKKYVAHVAKMSELLGDDADSAGYAAATVLTLETRLAQASMSNVDQRDPYKTYNKTAAAQLAERAPGLDWSAYLVAYGARIEDVNLRQPAFFAELARLFSDTALDQIRLYLRWHVIRSLATALPKRFEEESFEFNSRILQGIKEQKPRWKRVLESMDQHIGEELGQLYVTKAFTPEAKKRVLDLVADLRSALRDRIGTLEWLGDATKEQARKKLDAFAVKMGYPDKWRDHTALGVDRSAYARNVLRAREWLTARDLAKLGQPVDRTEWLMSPQTVNAYYNPLMNEIVFPAGILQPPFFDPSADDAVNYGAIGMVIGHEMSHGFDDSGSKYDAQGNLKEWWTADDRASYTSRTDAIVRQYEAYEPLSGEKVNGRLTLGENIGDIGGMRIAWSAFQRLVARTRPGSIDGFTPEQRFFLGFAQSWRSKIRDEAQRVRLRVDPHSPDLFRVFGPLSVMPEFHEAFGCDAESRMSAKGERPAIW